MAEQIYEKGVSGGSMQWAIFPKSKKKKSEEKIYLRQSAKTGKYSLEKGNHTVGGLSCD